MKNKLNALLKYTKKHKSYSALILAVLVIFVYGLFKEPNSTASTMKYVFSKVEKQDVALSITGSGQVSALDQVDLTAKVSGTIDYVNVKIGDKITKGQLLAHIESGDAAQNVENAKLNLANAKLSLERAQKDYKNQSGNSTASDFNQAMDSGYNAVAQTFIDLPNIIANVNNIFYEPSNSPYFSDLNVSSVGGESAIDYKYNAGMLFDAAKREYEKIFNQYKNTPPNASQTQLTDLISNTYNMVKNLNLALNGAHNSINYLTNHMGSNVPTQANTDKNLLSSYISTATSRTTQLSNSLADISEAEDSMASSELNLKSAELAVNQNEMALKDAQTALNDHSIISPFDGVIAKVPVEVGDSISNNTNIATVVTNTMKVTLSLNEVDAAKIKIGDKAAITFDAIDGLSMQGTVYEIDVVGTVSSGVVSYGVSISFDSVDERIKAGMTTNISIISGSAQNTLAISSSAISEKNGKNYVMIPISNTTNNSTTDKTTLKEIEVEIGISGDQFTEIKSGLSEGDAYVSSIVAANKNSSTNSNSLFSMFRGTGQRTTSESSSGTRLNSTSNSSNSSVRINSGNQDARPPF